VSPRYGDVFKIMNVPDRTDVLFHAGNFVRHTEACILLAEHFGKIKEKRGVLNSGKTFGKFMYLLKDYNEFHLTIDEHY